MIPDKENQKNIFNSITGLIDSDDNEIKSINPGVTKNQEVDLQSILGYLNQGEWTNKLSIGSIMQLQPLKLKELIEEG